MSADEISKFVCKGNADAEQFCKSFVAYCHLLDDCVDRDKPCDAERVAREAIDFIVQLTSNPFFVAHKAQLMGLIIQSFRAWADSNLPKYNGAHEIKPETEHERDVIKGFYHEVVFHVAAILGGWEHLTEVTKRCREYDFEVPTPSPIPNAHVFAGCELPSNKY
jgi:hypothetical protein